jgi:hypothetical protein
VTDLAAATVLDELLIGRSSSGDDDGAAVDRTTSRPSPTVTRVCHRVTPAGPRVEPCVAVRIVDTSAGRRVAVATAR